MEFSRLYSHIAKGKKSPVYLGNEIRHIRVVLNYAIEKDMVPRPFKYGPDFKLPTKRSSGASPRTGEAAGRRCWRRRTFERSCRPCWNR